MPDSITASGAVHWVGAGLASGRGLKVLADCARRTVLWNRDMEQAKQLTFQLGLGGQVALRCFRPEAFAAALSQGDVVVSMLPAAQHIALLKHCQEASAHFVCTSYTTDAIAEASRAAKTKGLIVITEAGLYPGVDRLIAHRLVEEANYVVGRRHVIASLASYCGGFPEVPNDFRYRFNWAPVRVLQALRSPARFISDFEARTATRPWEETQTLEVEDETFEGYPIRDSLPFIEQYGIPQFWRLQRFVRGTLRQPGWFNAWRNVFPVLTHGSDEEVVELAADLARRYSYGTSDNDRVFLFVSLDIKCSNETIWSGMGRLDLVGGGEKESAMARSVSLTAACAAMDALHNELHPGLHRATKTARDSARWLKRLFDLGLCYDIKQSTFASAIASQNSYIPAAPKPSAPGRCNPSATNAGALC